MAEREFASINLQMRRAGSSTPFVAPWEEHRFTPREYDRLVACEVCEQLIFGRASFCLGTSLTSTSSPSPSFVIMLFALQIVNLSATPGVRLRSVTYLALLLHLLTHTSDQE